MSDKKLILILAIVILLQSVAICFLTGRVSRPFRPAVAEIKPEEKVKVAFVFDDWGYNTRNLNLLYKLKRPVTIAVLPNLPFSKKIAEEAHAKDIEIMLHLPMEPKNPELTPEVDTIYTKMSEKEILDKFTRSLRSIPYAKGVSNHMGSKATEDERLMRVLFAKMKRQRLYFLDSLVTENSVCQVLARKVGLRFAQRAVFLDNENNQEYIIGQIQKLARVAKLHGFAVGIGHDRKLTLSAVSRMIPDLEKDGIKLVYISELAK